MDKKDILLVSYLRKDARTSLTKLSRKTGIPVSTIFQKIKNNFGNKISKYTSILDFSVFGFNMKAFLLLKAKKDNRDNLISFLNKSFNVNNMFKINNSWDVLVECVFEDLNNLEEFLYELEEKVALKAKEVHYVLADLKRESFISDPASLSLLDVCK